MSSASPTALQHLEARLGELLSALEGPALPAASTLGVSLAQLEQAFGEARSEGGSAEGERWLRCRRLHALATELVARRCGELARTRQACSALRQRLAGARAAHEGGASCDLQA